MCVKTNAKPLTLSPVQTSNFSLTSFLTSLFSRVYDEQFFLDGRTHEQVSWLKAQPSPLQFNGQFRHYDWLI